MRPAAASSWRTNDHFAMRTVRLTADLVADLVARGDRQLVGALAPVAVRHADGGLRARGGRVVAPRDPHRGDPRRRRGQPRVVARPRADRDDALLALVADRQQWLAGVDAQQPRPASASPARGCRSRLTCHLWVPFVSGLDDLERLAGRLADDGAVDRHLVRDGAPQVERLLPLQRAASRCDSSVCAGVADERARRAVVGADDDPPVVGAALDPRDEHASGAVGGRVEARRRIDRPEVRPRQRPASGRACRRRTARRRRTDRPRRR